MPREQFVSTFKYIFIGLIFLLRDRIFPKYEHSGTTQIDYVHKSANPTEIFFIVIPTA